MVSLVSSSFVTFPSRQTCPGALSEKALVMSQNDKSQLSSPVSFLVDAKWWRQALDDSLLFFPHSFYPALLLALANISLILCTNTLSDTNSLHQTLESLTQTLVQALVTSLLGIGLTLWALTIWLNRLTAFSRKRLYATNISDKNAAINKALLDISQNQKPLFKFWFVFSLYLLVPVIPLTFLIVLHTLAYSPTLKSLHLFTLPPQLNLILNAAIIIFTVITLAMTLVATVVAGKLDSAANAASLQSIKLFLNRGLILCLASALVLILNAIISAPQILLSANQISAAPELVPAIIAQIWLALTSAILWPLSISPIVELLRRDLVAA